MSEAEWKELDTIAFEIESSALAGYYWDLGNEHKPIILAAYRELKECWEDEKWLLDHPKVLAVHMYGDDGFALDYGHGTSAEIAYPTLHAAVTAARGK